MVLTEKSETSTQVRNIKSTIQTEQISVIFHTRVKTKKSGDSTQDKKSKKAHRECRENKTEREEERKEKKDTEGKRRGVQSEKKSKYFYRTFFTQVCEQKEDRASQQP